MATIRETFELEDKFSAPVQKYLNLLRQAAGYNAAFQASLNNIETATAAAATGIQNIAAKMEQSGNRAAAAQVKTDALTGAVKRLAGAVASIQTVKWLVNTSDQLTSINARLQLMTGSAEEAAAAQEQIYQAAMRSRGAYADMANFVSQLGMTAKNAFNDTGELIAFAEQIQKQIAISGSSGASAQAALTQLTQGLASGTLRGEELNSVLEQTPMIAKTIADYMGVTTGEMRNLASEGAVTAEVVKNAMLDASVETNKAFESMPMTWSQVFTQLQNVAIQTFQPLLDAVGQFAGFVSDNIGTIIPLFYALAAAVAFYSVAQWIATGAAKAFFTTLMSNPILLAVAVAIGVIVYAIYQWIQSVGGLQAAWLTALDWIQSFLEGWKIAFFIIVYGVMTKIDELSLKFLEMKTNILNWIGQMKVNVLTILQNMVNGAIDIINGMINTVNKLPFVSIQTIEKVTFAADAAVAEEAARQSREASLAAAEADANALATKRAQNITNMQNQAEIAHNNRLAGIEAARQPSNIGQAGGLDMSQYTNVPAYNEIAGIGADVGSISKDVGSIEKSVNMADEDIQDLVDMAERRYVNNINLTAQTPVITVNGANTGRTAADRMNLANTIRDILLEQASSSSVISTALPV